MWPGCSADRLDDGQNDLPDCHDSPGISSPGQASHARWLLNTVSNLAPVGRRTVWRFSGPQFYFDAGTLCSSAPASAGENGTMGAAGSVWRHLPSLASILRELAIWGSECGSWSVAGFPFSDGGAGFLERIGERVGLVQRLGQERLAEIGDFRFGAAAERGAVAARGRDDERRVVAQRVDEATRIAGVDDQHFPAH